MTSITELDGVSWCLMHDAPWFEGTTECDGSESNDDCIEAPLYIGPAYNTNPQATNGPHST